MSEVPQFVYYRQEDYAPVARRIPSFIIDIIVLVVALMATATVMQTLYVPPSVIKMPNSPEKTRLSANYLQPVKVRFVLGWLAFAILYHIALRRTRGGTLGYRLTRIRLIDATGRPPSWPVLVKRFLIAVPFTFFFAVTYWGCFHSPRRQTFHDQWSGTWLIRKNAQSAGPARPAYQTKLLGTWLLTYMDLEPVEAVEPISTSS